MNVLSENHSITFETKVYENDWKYILLGDYLKKMIKNCNIQFTERVLFINNVLNIGEVEKHAKIKIAEGILDKYYIVEKFEEQALTFFQIDKSSFKGGYYYSISELVSIYLCNTEYLFHLSSDSFIIFNNKNWIINAIKIFAKRNDIIVANPTWNCKYDEVSDESFSEIDDFFISSGFSDQCYLIRMDVFKNQIYNENVIDSERYPKYGGELFEKRVDSFMKKNNLFRITSKNVSYLHKNFPSKGVLYNYNIFIKYFAYIRLLRGNCNYIKKH